MKLENSILKDVRLAMGLNDDSSEFDTELLMHTNAALSVLNQNGVGNVIIVSDERTTWKDFQDVSAIDGNKHFQLIPLFVTLSTKIIFDPPPPSTVEHYSKSIDGILWRLKVAYEGPDPAIIIIED